MKLPLQTSLTPSDTFTLISTIVTAIGIVIGLMTLGIPPLDGVVIFLVLSVLGGLLLALLRRVREKWFNPSTTMTPPMSTPFSEEVSASAHPTLLPTDAHFLTQVFDDLPQSRVLMLLAQEHRVFGEVLEVLEQRLRQRFGGRILITSRL